MYFIMFLLHIKTPRVGFEPTTLRLTAECSAAELSRNIKYIYYTLKTEHNFNLTYEYFLTRCECFSTHFLGQTLEPLVLVT